MLERVDTVLVDIQDVGTRVYTFATTVLYLMQACVQSGKSVVILDRPNPINGRDVEGNLLEPEFASFVGPFPIPMRHGMTLGELMLFLQRGIQHRLQPSRRSGSELGSEFLLRRDRPALGFAFPQHALG